VALAKPAGSASNEDLKQRLLSYEARLQSLERGMHRTPPEIVTRKPKPGAPIIPSVSLPPPLPLTTFAAAQYPETKPIVPGMRVQWDRPPPGSGHRPGSNAWARNGSPGWWVALFLASPFSENSFKHNLNPAGLRVASGFLAGIRLVCWWQALNAIRNVVTDAEPVCDRIPYSLVPSPPRLQIVLKPFPFFGLINVAALSLIRRGVSPRSRAMVPLVVRDPRNRRRLSPRQSFCPPTRQSFGTSRLHPLLDSVWLAVAARRRMSSLFDPGRSGTVLMQSRGSEFLSAGHTSRRKQNIDFRGHWFLASKCCS